MCRTWPLGLVLTGCALLAACGGQHSGLTFPKGTIPKRHNVALRTPAHPQATTLQFRPVVGAVREGCPASAENPSPEQPATLPEGSDGCYQVGPSSLTVSRATVTGYDEGSEFWTVITLGRADAASLDDLARQNLDKQVALVAFGQVLSAPAFNTDSFNGVAEIHGPSKDQAAQLKAALSG